MLNGFEVIIDEELWLNKALVNGVPPDYFRAYQLILNQIVARQKKTIDVILRLNGRFPGLPIDIGLLERYLSGFSFDYKPLYNPLGRFGMEGCWEIDPNDPSHIIIYFNACASKTRQRFIKIHELFHFMERVDGEYLDFFDELINDTTLPESVINKLLEKSTDIAAAMFQMPQDYFVKRFLILRASHKKFKAAELNELAHLFGVTPQIAKYRLREC